MRKLITRSFRHSIVFTIEIFAAVIAALLLLWGGLLFRLDQGPLALGFLRDPLQQIVNGNLSDYDIGFQQVQLSWGGFKTPLELQMTDVEITDKTGTMPLASISRIGLELSKQALLEGEIAPRSINFYNIGLRITHNPENGLSLSLDDAGAETNKPPIFDKFNEKLFPVESKNAAGSKWKFLKTLRIINADVLLHSENLAEDIVLKNANVILKKQDGKISAVVDSVLQIRGEGAPIQGHVYFDPEAKTGIASLNFSKLAIKDIKALIPAEWQKRLTIEGVFNGTSHISFDENFTPQSIRFEAKVRDGRFNFDEVFATPIAFKKLEMTGNYDFKSRSLDLKNVRLKNDALELQLSGRSSYPEGGQKLELHTELENLPTNDIGLYWPPEVLTPARNWVTNNIRDGIVTKASQNLVLIRHVKDGKPALKIETLSGEINFEKAGVSYLKGFPIVENVAGKAKFDKAGFVIDVTSGVYADTRVKENSKVVIDGFESHPKINIALNIETSIVSGLKILDSAPYHFTSKLGLPIDAISGQADVTLGFRFPLKKHLTPADIKIEADAHSKNFGWRDIFKTLDFHKGDITLKLAGQEMTIAGSGLMDSAPVTLNWKSRFDDPAVKSVLNAATNLKLSDIFPEGFADVSGLTGRVPLSFEQRVLKDDKKSLMLQLDLNTAAFSIPKIGIEKQIGVPGTVRLDLHYSKDRLTRIENIDFKTPLLSFTGVIDFDTGNSGENRWSKAALKNIRYGNNDFSLKAENTAGHYLIDVDGRRFGVSRYLRADKKDDKSAVEEIPSRRHPVKISGKIDELVTAPGEMLRDARIFLVQNELGQIDQLELDGTAGTGQLYLRYKPDEKGLHSFRLEADDAGAALKTFGISRSIRGGILIVDGQPRDAQSPRDMRGRFQISNFTVIGAPVLARLLNGLSIKGLSSLLAGKGIGFTRLSGDFLWEEISNLRGAALKKMLTIANGKTSGASLGLTFEGGVDVLAGQIDISGNIVPVSGLNTAVEGIPVIGDILTAGGEGVFAATYTIKGDIGDPVTVVNPLAALAPGILRSIFFESGN